MNKKRLTRILIFVFVLGLLLWAVLYPDRIKATSPDGRVTVQAVQPSPAALFFSNDPKVTLILVDRVTGAHKTVQTESTSLIGDIVEPDNLLWDSDGQKFLYVEKSGDGNPDVTSVSAFCLLPTSLGATRVDWSNWATTLIQRELSSHDMSRRAVAEEIAAAGMSGVCFRVPEGEQAQSWKGGPPAYDFSLSPIPASPDLDTTADAALGWTSQDLLVQVSVRTPWAKRPAAADILQGDHLELTFPLHLEHPEDGNRRTLVLGLSQSGTVTVMMSQSSAPLHAPSAQDHIRFSVKSNRESYDAPFPPDRVMLYSLAIPWKNLHLTAPPSNGAALPCIISVQSQNRNRNVKLLWPAEEKDFIPNSHYGSVTLLENR